MAREHAVAVLVVASLLGLAGGGDDPTPKETAAQKGRLEVMKRHAAGYDVTLDTATPAKLALHGEPLVRFSNPVGGVVDGIVVAWKEGERPAVFAQIFQLKDGLWIHECQSLASAGLTMRQGKQTRWNPGAAADKFVPLSDAPRAAETAANRLLQMKAQAARFEVSEDFKMNFADRETSRYQLRLLATPVLRYQDPKAGINDAAVFAFVHGTDPELFLLIEHRGGDRAVWYYSLVPMTCWAVRAQLGGAEVWSVPERQGKSTPEGPYHVWVHRPDR